MPTLRISQVTRRLALAAFAALAMALIAVAGAAPGYAQSGDDVVSEVNGTPITRAAFQGRVRFVRWQYLNELVKLHELSGGNLALAGDYARGRVSELNDPAALGDAVLRQMEEEHLLWQAGEDLEQTPTAEDAAEREAAFFSAWTGVPAAELAANETAQAFIATWYEEAAAASGLTNDDLRAIFATEALQDRLMDMIASEIPPEELSIHSRHILCSFTPGSPAAVAAPSAAQRATAEGCIADALTRLGAGQDFAAVARDLSDDAASAVEGGDLGWVLVSYLTGNYASAAEGAELNTVIGPVETEYGLHLIEVLDRRMQTLTGDQLEESKYGYFETWIESLWAGAEVTRAADWSVDIPAAPGLDTLPGDVRDAVDDLMQPEQ